MKIYQGYIIKNKSKEEVVEILKNMKNILQKKKEEMLLQNIAQNLTYYHDLKSISFIPYDSEQLKLSYWKNYWIEQTTKNEYNSYKHDLSFVAYFYFQNKDTLIRIETGNYGLVEEWNIFSKTQPCEKYDDSNPNLLSLELKRQTKKWKNVDLSKPDFKMLFTDTSINKELNGQWEQYIPTYSERIMGLTEQLLLNYWENHEKTEGQNEYDFQIWKKTPEAVQRQLEIKTDLGLLLPLNIDFSEAKK